jgi:predicted dienelactone hydrolase
MLIAGALSFAENPPLQLADPRVRAAVAMSPQGVDPRLGLTPESWAETRIPILYMTGSNDRSGKQHDAIWRHDPFAYGPPGDKYFVSIQGANHMSFAGAQGIDDDMEAFTDRPYGYDQRRSGAGTSQPRAMYPGMESSRRTFDSIRMATLSFWDAYLKADAKGRDYLNGSANTLNGGRITIERK